VQHKQIAVSLQQELELEESRALTAYDPGVTLISGSELERILLTNLPHFQQLKELAQERNGVDRYTHTLSMINGLLAIRTGNYELFVRHDSERSKGNKLTLDQFADICCKASEILDSADSLLFMLLLVVTHDYGTLVDEKTHVTHSGRLCVEDLARLGFSQEDKELARLVVGNHDSIGSLLLGEISPDYVEKLYRQAQQYRSEARFFQYLWLLTVLDINGSGVGYLTAEKYNNLGSLHVYESFNRLTQVWPEMRIKLLRQSADIRGERAEDVQKFNKVNMQYLFKLVTYKDVVTGQHVVTEENFYRLIHVLNILWDYIHQLNEGGITPQINYITFSSDERQAAEQLNQRLSEMDVRKGPRLDYPEGFCQIYPYKIVGDYLVILNKNETEEAK
jgi:hypothetical protein